MGTWMATPIHLHMNMYSAISMLNTRSMTIAFKQFSENNGLSTILTKLIGADGTIKPHYVTVDSGLETDHNVAMGPHTWHNGDNDILANNRLTLRMHNGQDMRVNSHVTTLCSQITMHVATNNDD
eukprot:3800106-Amphidinium_carterae.1